MIILGSISDRDVAKKASGIFDKFCIEYTVTVASAHRTPGRVLEIIKEAHDDGVKVFIAISGLAAHLPGVVASHTTKSVIGIPVNAALDGMEAIFANQTPMIRGVNDNSETLSAPAPPIYLSKRYPLSSTRKFLSDRSM